MAIPTPSESPVHEGRSPVVLVTTNPELSTRFEHTITAQDKAQADTKLQVVLRSASESLVPLLTDVAPNTEVGLSGSWADDSKIEELATAFPTLRFFDYQIVYNQDQTVLQVRYN